ncbi:hypothetical protein DFP72DRAFT_860950 [Ephemerocybe angulata]|uniref:Uncharacterized protein n=1 Tax=Ephemerocybe angulata TaxID=980116 RepID=A0A8H6LVB8_9AGAR|nr:hypothetical protein DFP72DRAFT_860950 [Tulosesus angulatus]
MSGPNLEQDDAKGAHRDDLVVCIVCGTGVKLNPSFTWARVHWDTHAARLKHRRNMEKYEAEAQHGPIGSVRKSTMPRYNAVWVTEGHKPPQLAANFARVGTLQGVVTLCGVYLLSCNVPHRAVNALKNLQQVDEGNGNGKSRVKARC